MRGSTAIKTTATGIAAAVLVMFSSINATAITSGDVYAADPSGNGTLAKINPITGEQISLVPAGATFPSHPNDYLANISGLAINPTNGVIYALDYDCEIITIDANTGVSTPVATAPSGAGSCEGLAISPSAEFLVGFGATVKKYDVSSNSYVPLAGAPVFSTVNWLSFEPTTGLIFVSDNYSVKTMTTTGISVVTKGSDSNSLSSVAFTTTGTALGGYWGSDYFTGQSSTFPTGMIASTAAQSSLSNDYWIAAYFTSSPSPSPTPTSTTAPQNTSLAETGVGSLVMPALVALGLLIFGIALLVGRRKNS